MAEGLITPDELRWIADEKAKAKEALEQELLVDDDCQHLREAFLAQDIDPQVFGARVPGGPRCGRARRERSAGRDGGSRTRTARGPSDFKSDASTGSATSPDVICLAHPRREVAAAGDGPSRKLGQCLVSAAPLPLLGTQTWSGRS